MGGQVNLPCPFAFSVVSNSIGVESAFIPYDMQRKLRVYARGEAFCDYVILHYCRSYVSARYLSIIKSKY